MEWPRGQCCGGRAIHCPLGERTGSPRTGIVLSPPPGTGLGLRDCSRSNFCPINRLRVESNNWFQPDADLICRRPARVCHANYAVQLPGWAVSTTRICDASYVKCLSEPRSVVMHEDTYPRIEVNYASTAPKRCEFDDEQHVSGRKPQRRMFVAPAATASVLLAAGAPIAAASPSNSQLACRGVFIHGGRK